MQEIFYVAMFIAVIVLLFAMWTDDRVISSFSFYWKFLIIAVIVAFIYECVTGQSIFMNM